MSSDRQAYYASSRSDDRALPPLREIVGDALDRSPVSPYSFNFHAVNSALPGASKSYGHYPSSGGHYSQRGPTLPPIRNYPSTSTRSSTPTIRDASAERQHHDPRRRATEPPAGQPHSTVSNPQPATGPLPYSYNVLRAQQGDLVDVRTPSARAQGILRPTAIIDDEDESHKRYKCDWAGCEKKYDRPSSLEVHRNTHTGHQPYPCLHPGCPRAFNVKSNMLRHFRSHRKAKTSQTSTAHPDPDSDSDKDDDKAKRAPGDSDGRYFRTASLSSHKQPSSSSSATHSTSKKSHEAFSPSTEYYSSSRRH